MEMHRQEAANGINNYSRRLGMFAVRMSQIFRPRKVGLSGGVITYNWEDMKSRSSKKIARLKSCEDILLFPDMIAHTSESASISGLGTLL